jgi:hypothetical protein
MAENDAVRNAKRSYEQALDELHRPGNACAHLSVNDLHNEGRP